MKIQPLLSVLLAVMLFGVALRLEATPIAYDESVDGPLKEHPVDAIQLNDFLTLGLGTNVWVGTLFDDRYVNRRAVFDTAAFRLPTNLQIEQIRITTNNFQVVSGNWASYRVEIFRYDVPDLAIESLGFEDFPQPNLVQENRSVLDDMIPMVDGLYSISFAAHGFSYGVFPASFDYRIEIDTREVLTIEDRLEALSNFVKEIGPGSSLADKVAISAAYYAVPDLLSACGVLDDFINQVRGLLRGSRITDELANQLIEDAVSIKSAMECD